MNTFRAVAVNSLCCNNKQNLERYARTMKFLVLSTLLLIPITIFINVYLSLRLDTYNFHAKQTGYKYKTLLFDDNRLALVLWWVHKIATIIWTCTVIIHMMVLTWFGTHSGDSAIQSFFNRWFKRDIVNSADNTNTKLNTRARIPWWAHAFLGSIVALSAFISAIAGGYVMLEGDSKYHGLTRWFFYGSFISTLIASGYLLFERIIIRLFPTKFSSKVQGTQFYPALHTLMGYLLVMPPLCMIVQFSLYAIVHVIIPGQATPQQDYSVWKYSLLASIFFGGVSTWMLFFHAWLFQKRLPELTAAGPNDDLRDERYKNFGCIRWNTKNTKQTVSVTPPDLTTSSITAGSKDDNDVTSTIALLSDTDLDVNLIPNHWSNDSSSSDEAEFNHDRYGYSPLSMVSQLAPSDACDFSPLSSKTQLMLLDQDDDYNNNNDDNLADIIDDIEYDDNDIQPFEYTTNNNNHNNHSTNTSVHDNDSAIAPTAH